MIDYSTYISRCLHLAHLGDYYTAPNPLVGAVLVYGEGKEARIIGEGWHQQFGGAHAEVNCFANIKPKDKMLIKDSTLFVNLEPCSHHGKTPPCTDLIIQNSIKRCVIGSLDPNPIVSGKGVARLQEHGIEVIQGVMERECREINKRFLCLYEKSRPYVILKWAQTADGFLDYKRLMPADGKLANSKPLVISTPLSKMLVHRMRAENMSILVGANTALLDNPSLRTTRWVGRNPIRILLNRHHQIPKDSKIFSSDADTIVYSNNTEWSFVLDDLAKRGIHSVLVEGGAQILNHIIETGIYDEIHIEKGNMHIGAGVSAPKV